jgi:hypothetical protein
MFNIRTVLRKLGRELDGNPSEVDKAIKKFAKGSGFFSDKGFLRQICQTYVDQIDYDDFGGTELDLIEADRQKRMDAVELVVQSLEKAAEYTPADPAFKPLLSKAADGVERFLEMVPAADLKSYEDLVKAVRKADMDLSGKLEGRELLELTEDQQNLYSGVSAILIIYT